MKEGKALFKKFSNPVIKSTFVYTIASFFNAAIPFIILPVLTKYLSTEEYGIVSTFMVCNSIFLLVIGLEQQGYISVSFFSSTPQMIRAIISNILIISFVIFVVFSLVIFYFQSFFEEVVQIDSRWILYAVGVSFFQFIGQVNLTIWQLEKKSIKYAVFQIANSLVNYGLSVALIVAFGMAEAGRIYGIVFTSVALGIFCLLNLSKRGILTLLAEKEIAKHSLLFSLPLVPHALAGWVNNSLDKILINNFVGVSENGIYSISYQIGMGIGIIASSFNRAFVPFIYEKLNTNLVEEKKRLIKYTYVYYAMLIALSFLLIILSPFILALLVDEKFLHAGVYLPWIIVGFTFDGLYYGVVNYIYFSRKTLLVSVITFSGCLIHFGLSYALIPKMGPIAAAYSTTITYIFSFIFAWIIAAKIYPMPWFSFYK